MYEELDGAPPRVLTRLTVLALPEETAAEVLDELVAVLTFESGNSAPAVIDNGGFGSLIWRGYLTGGLRTLYEQVSRLADEHGFSAMIADERLEVHIAADRAKVLVIGPLTDTMEISRPVWEHRVEHAVDPDELAQWFVFDRIRDTAEEILLAAPEAPEHGAPEADDRPAAVDYARVDGATYNLLEHYEPDGSLQDAVVECRPMGSRWRTDFQAPYVDDTRSPGVLAGWHVAQWELTALPDEWSLVARADAELATILACLPHALRSWAIERTAAALALADHLSPADHDGAAERLRRELDEARDAHSSGW